MAVSRNWSGLDQKNGGARNDVPQVPRSLTNANGLPTQAHFGIESAAHIAITLVATGERQVQAINL